MNMKLRKLLLVALFMVPVAASAAMYCAVDGYGPDTEYADSCYGFWPNGPSSTTVTFRITCSLCGDGPVRNICWSDSRCSNTSETCTLPIASVLTVSAAHCQAPNEIYSADAEYDRGL